MGDVSEMYTNFVEAGGEEGINRLIELLDMGLPRAMCVKGFYPSSFFKVFGWSQELYDKLTGVGGLPNECLVDIFDAIVMLPFSEARSKLVLKLGFVRLGVGNVIGLLTDVNDWHDWICEYLTDPKLKVSLIRAIIHEKDVFEYSSLVKKGFITSDIIVSFRIYDGGTKSVLTVGMEVMLKLLSSMTKDDAESARRRYKALCELFGIGRLELKLARDYFSAIVPSDPIIQGEVAARYYLIVEGDVEKKLRGLDMVVADSLQTTMPGETGEQVTRYVFPGVDEWRQILHIYLSKMEAMDEESVAQMLSKCIDSEMVLLLVVFLMSQKVVDLGLIFKVFSGYVLPVFEKGFEFADAVVDIIADAGIKLPKIVGLTAYDVIMGFDYDEVDSMRIDIFLRSVAWEG